MLLFSRKTHRLLRIETDLELVQRAGEKGHSLPSRRARQSTVSILRGQIYRHATTETTDIGHEPPSRILIYRQAGDFCVP